MKLKPTINQLVPNASFVLYEGTLHFKCEEWDVDLYSVIEFHWTPKPSITVKAPLGEYRNTLKFKQNIILCVELERDGQIVPVLMRSLLNDSINGEMPYYIDGNTNINIDSIRFEIPNLFNFQSNDESHTNTLKLKCNDYDIYIQSEGYLHLNYNSIDGGFISNGRGHVRGISKPLIFDELLLIFSLLGKFLSFIHGRRIEIMFLEGFQGEVRAFKFYPIKDIDENSLPWTWFTFKLDIKDNHLLESMWERMYQLYQNDADKDVMDLLMHFYAESTYNRNSVETSVTIIQNALELLSSRILVEDNNIIDRNDYDKISASSLLNILLLWAGISNEIPRHFNDLIAFASGYNLKTGPQAITFVRNCIVHPHLKNREKFKRISHYIKIQVLRIGVYYTELLILKYLNYNGHYDSRLNNESPSKRELVPWAG